MCRDHGKAIDSNDPEFTVERLREWKRQAEKESWRRVLRNEAGRAQTAVDDAQLAARIRAAAKRIFKFSGKPRNGRPLRSRSRSKWTGSTSP